MRAGAVGEGGGEVDDRELLAGRLLELRHRVHVPGRLGAGQVVADPGAPVDRGGGGGRAGGRRRHRFRAGGGRRSRSGRRRRGRGGLRGRLRRGLGVLHGDVDRRTGRAGAASVGGGGQGVGAVAELGRVEAAAVGEGRARVGRLDGAVDGEVDPSAAAGGLDRPGDRAGDGGAAGRRLRDDAELDRGGGGAAGEVRIFTPCGFATALATGSASAARAAIRRRARRRLERRAMPRVIGPSAEDCSQIRPSGRLSAQNRVSGRQESVR